VKNLFISVIFIIIATFTIQYYISSLILSSNTIYIRNSLGKFYFSLIIAFIFGILEVIIFDYINNSFSLIYYLILSMLIYFYYNFFKNQQYVDISNYKEYIIEHISHLLFVNDKILENDIEEKYKNRITELNNNIKNNLILIENI
jgi:hypothetical protein